MNPKYFLFAVILSVILLTINAEANTQRDEPLVSTKKIVTGGVVGALQNAAKYSVKTVTDPTNIVTVFSCTSINRCSNVLTSVDLGIAGKVAPHVKVTAGVKNNVIPISKGVALHAGVAGTAMKTLSKAAPVLMFASVAYDVSDVLGDVWNGETKLAKQKFVAKASSYAGGSYGATYGAIYGTMAFPGVGTLLGGLFGGVVGGVVGGIGGEALIELLL
uniref:DUF5683 domain-containing protein n=1 Tax=Caenorhabditis tropicalis TaxID=1561998 RepID=A0A1I7TWT0_9PELO